MNDIRLICLDMDGTLLDDDHATVPPRNVAALRAAAEAGVDVLAYDCRVTPDQLWLDAPVPIDLGG